MSIKHIFKKRDYLFFILLILIVIIALVFMFNRKPGLQIRVSYNNEIVDTFNLNESIEKTYTLGNSFNTVKIENNEVSVTEANCDNQICVNSQSINLVGETIACLPHKLIVEIIEE